MANSSEHELSSKGTEVSDAEQKQQEDLLKAASMQGKDQPLVTNIFTADPSAHVFEGKIYIYPSHDIESEASTNDDGTAMRLPCSVSG